MTSGVYRLNFKNGSTYVGKSNDMERRWKEHGDKLVKGKAAVNMQAAYKGGDDCYPEVLLECHVDHIDIMEAYYIWKLKPDLNNSAAAFLSVGDAEILEINLNMLKFSTGEHIAEIAELQEQVRDNLKELEKTESERIKELKKDADLAWSCHSDLLRRYMAEKNKTFWQKLFG